jgi:hypothetical protein
MGRKRRLDGDRTPFERDGHLGPIPAIDTAACAAFAVEVDDQLGPSGLVANERLDGISRDNGDTCWSI